MREVENQTKPNRCPDPFARIECIPLNQWTNQPTNQPTNHLGINVRDYLSSEFCKVVQTIYLVILRFNFNHIVLNRNQNNDH